LESEAVVPAQRLWEPSGSAEGQHPRRTSAVATVVQKCDCPDTRRCKHSWVVRYRAGGRQRERPFRHDQKSVANDFALKLEHDKKAGSSAASAKRGHPGPPHPATSAANSAPSSQHASRSALPGVPVTVTAGLIARQASPVVIDCTARTAPVVSLAPCTYSP
jgi:hypothetical protein